MELDLIEVNNQVTRKPYVPVYEYLHRFNNTVLFDSLSYLTKYYNIEFSLNKFVWKTVQSSDLHRFVLNYAILV